MKGLILVGGFGTRLRPLTISCPKPLVEFLNVPILEHQVAALVKVGVKEIVLAIGYQPEPLLEFIKHLELTYTIKVHCSQEVEPMGTAGPIRLAKDILLKDNPEGLFFVFNSDVACEFPLEKMLQFHKAHGKEGTISLAQVTEPQKYGVVVYGEDGEITQFIEKPEVFISNKINAGLYIFNVSIIERIELKPTSIEREIFPKMAMENQLFAMPLEGFWMDIGQPKDYLQGTTLMLDFYRRKHPERLAKGPNIYGNVLIDPTAKIHINCVIGPDVVIGPGCQVEEGVRLKNVVLLKNSKVNNCSWICDTVVGWNSTIGKWVRIEGVSVFGDDVQIKDEVYINQCFVLPHRSVNTNQPIKGTIIM